MHAILLGATVAQATAAVFTQLAASAVNTAGSPSSSSAEFVLHDSYEAAMAATDADAEAAAAAADSQGSTWTQAGIVVGFISVMIFGVLLKRLIYERRVAQAAREAEEMRKNPRHFTPEQ